MTERAGQDNAENSAALSDTAAAVLADMAREPGRIQYHTEVLGGMFGDADVERLDAAYRELFEKGLVEPAGVTISFFGAPKRLYRITPAGEGIALGGAA